jgi:LacI family transcriptional regulator
MSSNTGRTSAAFAGSLRKTIAAGKVGAGQFLPSERELAERHELTRKTVRRALKSLEAEGVIATVPRCGYRVLPRDGRSAGAAPAAYVCELPEGMDRLTGRYQAQLAEFHRAADRRGWPLLAAGTRGKSRAETLAQLSAARAAGAILDTADRELIQAIMRSGIPAVLVDAWREDVEIDSVMQDGHQGGLLAVAHLAARGHRRIAWFGPPITEAHSQDRFGGVAAGLARAGIALAPELCVATGEAQAKARARELLSRGDRPAAVIALWGGLAAAVAGAATELGLAPGRDLELVGWSMEETYETAYRPLFKGSRVPPTVTWSVRTMAEAAFARLAERRLNPGLPALRVRIPMRLKLEA